jgi:hypothetical protein
MKKITRFILGLTLVQDRVVRSSFYNSSGDSAGFEVTSLTAEEQRLLESWGWEVGCERIRDSKANISFADWGPE